MRALFIQCNGIQESLGIASLAACLEKAGHTVDLLLTSHCKDLIPELKQYQPGIICFSAVTGAHEEIFHLSRFIKKHMDIPIIVGGPHATFYTEETSAEQSIDYICLGEGENALVELVHRLANEEDTTNVPNIWARTPKGWVRNELGSLAADLDSLPIPKREIYYKYNFLRKMPMKRFITGMWCPYACTYCHNIILQREYHNKGDFVRRKSVQRVIDEIRHVMAYAPLNRVHFSDDLFTLNSKWLTEFAAKFPSQIGIPFSCNTRLDCAPEIVDLLAEAGCAGAAFGFESGSERMRRKYLKKHWTNEQAMQVVQYFKRRGILTASNNMIALPGETIDDVITTINWNDKIGFDFVRVDIFMPYPKLDLVQIAKNEGLLDKDFSLKDLNTAAIAPSFNKEHSNELINLRSLFYVAIKLRFIRRFILKYLIRLKPNKIFDMIGGCLNLYQHYMFFHLQPLSTWEYFKNTMNFSKGFSISNWQKNQKSLPT